MKQNNDRHQKAYDLRASGMKWADVGAELGVSASRASVLAGDHDRHLRFCQRNGHDPKPLEPIISRKLIDGDWVTVID